MGKAHLIQSNLLRRIRATGPHDIIMGLCCFYRCKNNQSFNICYRHRPGRVRRKYGMVPARQFTCRAIWRSSTGACRFIVQTYLPYSGGKQSLLSQKRSNSYPQFLGITAERRCAKKVAPTPGKRALAFYMGSALWRVSQKRTHRCYCRGPWTQPVWITALQRAQ